jgi:hypothetical protein
MHFISDFPISKRWPAEYPDRLQLYSLPTPNGVKVSIMLEEIGLAYEPHLVDFNKGDQKTPEFDQWGHCRCFRRDWRQNFPSIQRLLAARRRDGGRDCDSSAGTLRRPGRLHAPDGRGRDGEPHAHTAVVGHAHAAAADA